MSQQPKTIRIIHFNDVYNIEPAAREPVGGAARFVAEVKRRTQGDAPPLVVFSGDVYNPSLLSTITKGTQMPPILNAAGVAVSCLGVGRTVKRTWALNSFTHRTTTLTMESPTLKRLPVHAPFPGSAPTPWTPPLGSPWQAVPRTSSSPTTAFRCMLDSAMLCGRCTGCTIQVGFVGLIEPEWLGSIASVDAEQVTYIPFETAAAEYAATLRVCTLA